MLLLVFLLQSEYIQLCKTLYTLLHGSADEQELFQAMSRVANALLKTGEQNVHSVSGSILEQKEKSMTQLQPTSVEYSIEKVVSPDTSSDELQTAHFIPEDICFPPPKENNVSPEDEKFALSCSTEKSQRNELREANVGDSKAINNKVEAISKPVFDEDESKLGHHQNLSEMSEPLSPVTEIHDKQIFQNCEKTPMLDESTSDHDESTSDHDVLKPLVSGVQLINDEELQRKWYLTFEQFVSNLQQEPDLCQFFAEQNSIDLDGSSGVDPLLSHYTRTVLASLP